MQINKLCVNILATTQFLKVIEKCLVTDAMVASISIHMFTNAPHLAYSPSETS